MNVNLDLTLTHLITIVTIFFGMLWGLVKILAAQQEKGLTEKFAALNAAIGNVGTDLRKEADATRQLETAFLLFKADLPRDYVRRDDFVRAIGTIETRIDNFALRMERALQTTHKGA